MSGFEENEISANANGGTEIAKRKLAGLIKPELLEQTQIVCSRVRDLEPDKIRIFWCHDLPHDPESKMFADESFRDKFHHFVFISNWQYEQYRTVLGFPYSQKCTVLESGFEPIEVDWTKKKSNTIRFCYTSTPQRGLNLLIPTFDLFSQKYDNVHLDVFSSFKIYGWDDADKQFEPLYDQIRNHPKMTYHGFTPNDKLKDYLKTAHIHAYPSTWIETSCRAMLEAMSAGLLCVHPNYGALAETSGSLNFMYQGDSDPNIHANIFYQELNSAYQRYTEDNDTVIKYLRFVKSYTDNRYHIEKVHGQWESLLDSLVKKYPTPESRALPAQQFVYRTT